MRTAFFAALLLSSIASLGWAQQKPMTEGQKDFIDKNADGSISRSEFAAYMQAAFRYLDANRNGSLSRAETAKIFRQAQFDAADANHNGSISEHEFMQRAADDFAAADRDGSGSLK